MTNELINNDNEINNIFDNIKDLVINSRNKVYQTVKKRWRHKTYMVLYIPEMIRKFYQLLITVMDVIH